MSNPYSPGGMSVCKNGETSAQTHILTTHCAACTHTHTHNARIQIRGTAARALLPYSSHWLFFYKYINNKIVIKTPLQFVCWHGMTHLRHSASHFPSSSRRSQKRLNVLMCDWEHLHSWERTACWGARLSPVTGCHSGQVSKVDWCWGDLRFKSWPRHVYCLALGSWLASVPSPQKIRIRVY